MKKIIHESDHWELPQMTTIISSSTAKMQTTRNERGRNNKKRNNKTKRKNRSSGNLQALFTQPHWQWEGRINTSNSTSTLRCKLTYRHAKEGGGEQQTTPEPLLPHDLRED
jgi:hypothetical protein